MFFLLNNNFLIKLIRYTTKEGYSDGDHKIEVFTPPVVKITPEIFFRSTVKTTVGGIRALQPVRYYITHFAFNYIL